MLNAEENGKENNEETLLFELEKAVAELILELDNDEETRGTNTPEVTGKLPVEDKPDIMEKLPVTVKYANSVKPTEKAKPEVVAKPTDNYQYNTNNIIYFEQCKLRFDIDHQINNQNKREEKKNSLQKHKRGCSHESQISQTEISDTKLWDIKLYIWRNPKKPESNLLSDDLKKLRENILNEIQNNCSYQISASPTKANLYHRHQTIHRNKKFDDTCLIIAYELLRKLDDLIDEGELNEQNDTYKKTLNDACSELNKAAKIYECMQREKASKIPVEIAYGNAASKPVSTIGHFKENRKPVAANCKLHEILKEEIKRLNSLQQKSVDAQGKTLKKYR